MANTTEKVIKTIIVIRNDTEDNLIANGDDLILRKGEMCWTISEDISVPSKLKVGDGTSNWNQLPYVNFSSTNSEEVLTADNKVLQIKDNIISLIGADDPENVGKSFRISEDGTAIEWFIAADKDKVDANTTLIDQINKSLTDDYYNKTETDALVSKVFVFKGTKTSKTELDEITNPKVGDVWVVKEEGNSEGNLYVYAEDEDGNGYWEDFPLTVDLSDYVLSTDFNDLKDRVNTIETEIDTLKTKVDALEAQVPTTEDNEELEELKDYIDSVKPTINTLPDTIFSEMAIQTLSNGNIRIIGTHINKDNDGTYNIGGESILGTLKPVTPNGNPGLMTGEDKAKIDRIFEAVQGGEQNTIESIQVGGEALPISLDKKVNIPIAGEKLGVVKNYPVFEDETDDNTEKPNNIVHINEDGTMVVPEINIDTLVSTGDFILNGGDADSE